MLNISNAFYTNEMFYMVIKYNFKLPQIIKITIIYPHLFIKNIGLKKYTIDIKYLTLSLFL